MTGVTLTLQAAVAIVIAISPREVPMPRNQMIDVGATPVQLTAGAAAAVFLYNEGPASITIAGSADDQAPVMAGPVIQPGMALPSTMPLAEIFPGLAGVSRLFAVAGVGGATVFVSHV